MLEATRLDQLPQDILNQIWTIYSHWRNIKLWTDRYQGFRNKNYSSGIIKVDKSNVNVISNIIKYNIPDEKRGFNNYHDILYLECKVDVEHYRRLCGYCNESDCYFDLQCEKCGCLFCRSCSFHNRIPIAKIKCENGVWILKECHNCKVDLST